MSIADAGRLSNLAWRIIFAVVAVPVVLLAAWYGDWALAALLSIAAAVAAWEFFRLARAGGAKPLDNAGIAIAALVPLSVHARYLGLGHMAAERSESFTDALSRTLAAAFALSLTGAAVLVLAVFAATIWARGAAGRPLGAAAFTIFGVLYTGVMLSFAYAIRYHEYAVGGGGEGGRTAGAALLFLSLILTWTSDTGGYFVGRALGRRKLIPSVSPGKTVAGAVGALIATILVCWLYVRAVLIPYAQLGLSPLHVILFGGALSVATQVGDITESLIKREAGMKDSSGLLPGHGGVLDRVDGLLFSLPVAYWLYGHMLIPAPR